MNYQSTLSMKNTEVRGLTAQTASFIFSTGQSSVLINDSYINNCTSGDSCLTLVSPMDCEVNNSEFVEANGISIQQMKFKKFIIEGSKFITDGSCQVFNYES